MSRALRAHLPEHIILQTLSDAQLAQLEEFARLLHEFNRRINLVSRETDHEISTRHIPHVLALAELPFPPDSTVVDWGTGGGLPALPLAIVFPDVAVHAVDAVEKKVLAVRTMARRLGLANVDAWAGDAMRWPGQATHSVSRATAPLATLWAWHRRVALPVETDHDEWMPGLLCLKGGDLDEERAELEASCHADKVQLPHVDVRPIHDRFSDPYFAGKSLVHVYLAPS